MMTDRGRLLAKGLMGIMVVFLLGCQGYRYASEYNQLQESIQTIAIPFFKNESFESNIEASFTKAAMNEFIKNRRFAVVSDGGDATLYGVVKEFRIASIAYSSEDRARQYRAFATLEVTLRSNATGEVLWRNPQMTENREYSVSENIAYTDDNKNLAIDRIALDLAERMYEEIVFGY
jgi:hypothetical protein